MRELREAEVQDLHAPVPGDEQVLGLQIAMHDPLLVRRRQAMRNLQRIVDRLPLRQLPARQRRAQRLPLEQLRHDVRSAVAFIPPDVMDRGDVRMIQNPCRPGLLLETAQAIRVGRERGRQHLDRDLAAQARILRPIHLSHPARADLTEHFIGTKTTSCCDRHECSPGSEVLRSPPKPWRRRGEGGS